VTDQPPDDTDDDTPPDPERFGSPVIGYRIEQLNPPEPDN
jgi:hypothetical protein